MKRIVIPVLCLATALAALAQEGPPTGAAAAPGPEPLVTEGVVAAPPAELWRVFTTAEGYRRLGVAKAEVDLRPGGLIRSAYNPATPLDGPDAIQTEILAYEPERFIATRIHRPPQNFPFKEAWKHVWVVTSLTDLGDGRTDVRLAMMGFGSDPESRAMREFFRTGNDWVLKTLQSHYAAVPAPTRPAHADDPLDPVDVTTIVTADRPTVWRTLTTADGWRAFFGVPATIGTRPGEPFEILFDPEAEAGARGSEGCTLLSLVPDEMLSFTWSAPPKFAFMRTQRTWVVVTLDSPSPATTRVRLRELGFRALAAAHPERREEVAAVRAYFAAAWPRVLDALADHLAATRGPAPTAAAAPLTRP